MRTPYAEDLKGLFMRREKVLDRGADKELIIHRQSH
jgi:hypothetical protein